MCIRDRHADDAVAQLLDEGVHGITSGAVDNAAYCSLRRSVALAVANALSCEVNAPEALAERGFAVSDPSDRSFFRSDDAVVLVGAGMLLRDCLLYTSVWRSSWPPSCPVGT